MLFVSIAYYRCFSSFIHFISLGDKIVLYNFFMKFVQYSLCAWVKCIEISPFSWKWYKSSNYFRVCCFKILKKKIFTVNFIKIMWKMMVLCLLCNLDYNEKILIVSYCNVSFCIWSFICFIIITNYFYLYCTYSFISTSDLVILLR